MKMMMNWIWSSGLGTILRSKNDTNYDKNVLLFFCDFVQGVGWMLQYARTISVCTVCTLLKFILNPQHLYRNSNCF